jgi:hypothetical protein
MNSNPPSLRMERPSVWVPFGGFSRFVLVDDAGAQLATGVPTGPGLPSLREREMNYEILRGGRYARAADAYAAAGAR